MDFDQINSVSDLINQNNEMLDEDAVVAKLLKPVYEEDPSVGLACAIDILRSLLTLHHDVVQKHVGDGEAELAAMWAGDMVALDKAIEIVKEIKL